MKLDEIHGVAASFAETEQKPHFHKLSFRVKGKIFLTTDAQKGTITVKLKPSDQSVFLLMKGVTAASGAWGKQGWTEVDQNLDNETIEDAIICSYRNVAPKKLAERYSRRI